MQSERPDFSTALDVFQRVIFGAKAKKPRLNLTKYIWVLVHESSPEYQRVLAARPLAKLDGFVLARGARRSGWADEFPSDCLACLISIGSEQRGFPVRIAGREEANGRMLDALHAIFDGASEAETPSVLRTKKGGQ